MNRGLDARFHRPVAITRGAEAFAGLYRLLEAMGGEEDVRMRDYLRKMRHLGGLRGTEG